MRKDVLTRPFPPDLIRQRQGQGGKTLHYIETHAVISRLNEGCDAWSFEIVEHQVLEEEVVVVAKLTADGVLKMAFGGTSITRDRDGRPVSIADDLKAAGSDALKKAASLLGVGLELYGGGLPAPSHVVQQQHAPRAVQPSDRLTGKQYSALQSITRRQNIATDDLTYMLEERFKKAELAHLTRREASSLLSELTNANGNHA
jgi:hypothetical protein